MFSISTMVQQDNFLTYIKNSKYAYYYPLFVFILETALRVGEVCGLTWDDVDLEHGFVNITHQLQYNNVGKDACQYQILTPKSKSGVRNVPLSNAARDALMEQMKNDIIQVISKYVDIDTEGLDIKVTKTELDETSGTVNALLANIPIKEGSRNFRK